MVQQNGKPLVSIVVLNFNAESLVANCLRSLLHTDYPNFELIFVDNGSTDRSVQIVREKFGNDPRVRVFENGANLGWPAGITQGVLHSAGEYVSVIEPDTEADRAWLNALVEVLEQDSSIGAAQCKTLFLDDRSKLESVGGELDYLGIESPKTALAVGTQDDGRFDRIREIFYARGAAFIFRRSLFRKVGGLDPSYFLGGYDDIDFSWRIRLAGYKVMFVPKSVIYHAGGRLIARIHWPLWYYHLRKNHIATLVRNYELKNIVKYLPMYLALSLVYGLYQLRQGRPKILVVTIGAIFWNIRNSRGNFKERAFVQKHLRSVSDTAILKMMSKPTLPRHIISTELIKKIPGKVYYTKLESQ